MTNKGLFQKLQQQDIEIQEYSLENWLFELGSDTRTQASVNEAMNEANEAFSIEGHVQVAVESGIYRSAYNVGGAPSTHIAMPVPGEISRQMDNITTKIISNLSQGIEKTLDTDMRKEATTFSSTMREKLVSTEIPRWMKGIANIFLPDVEIPANPFWFMWTAPYLSSEYPQRGFATQFQR